jgi:hypothetical protein
MIKNFFMKIDFMPKSRSGKWAVGLGIAFVALIALSVLVAVTIGGNAANIAAVIAANPLLLILNVTLNLALNLAGLLSLVFGIITIIKYKEWSVCKSLAMLYGLALLLFLLGEFLFPH